MRRRALVLISLALAPLAGAGCRGEARPAPPSGPVVVHPEAGAEAPPPAGTAPGQPGAGAGGAAAADSGASTAPTATPPAGTGAPPAGTGASTGNPAPTGTLPSSLGDPPPGSPSTTTECRVDQDCVPAACCHATACTARATAPGCEGMMCTKECRGGTLDCGGRCACQAGRCTAQLMGGGLPR